MRKRGKDNEYMKKILIAAHYFAPCSLVGARRPAYFADYLSNKGREVIVCKAHNRYYGNDVSGQSLERNNIQYINVEINEQKNSIINAIKWLIAYKREINEIIAEHKIDLIFISGGPFFYFLLGSFFKKKYGIPFVLDFRDPWYDRELEIGLKGKIINIIKYFLEKKSLGNADLIINVTESLTKMCITRNPEKKRGRFVTIYNGYDDKLLNNNNTTRLKDHFSEGDYKIGIFGKFSYYNIKHADILLESVSELMSELNKKITIYHLGSEEEYLIKKTELGLKDQFIYMGNREYNEGIEIMKNMDVMILNNRSKYALGTKVFDYMFINKPIIAFIEKESELGALLNKFGNGFTVQSKSEFKRFIKYIIDNNITCLDTNIDFRKYSREFQAELMSDELKKIM